MEPELYTQQQNYLSVWIFVFFLMYYANISYFNPIILLIIATILVISSVVFVYLETKNLYYSFKFSLVNFFIKIIPIYLIIDRPVYFHDVVISVVMCFLYYVYTTYYKQFNVYEFYMQMPNDFIKQTVEKFVNYKKEDLYP